MWRPLIFRSCLLLLFFISFGNLSAFFLSLCVLLFLCYTLVVRYYFLSFANLFLLFFFSFDSFSVPFFLLISNFLKSSSYIILVFLFLVAVLLVFIF